MSLKGVLNVLLNRDETVDDVLADFVEKRDRLNKIAERRANTNQQLHTKMDQLRREMDAAGREMVRAHEQAERIDRLFLGNNQSE